MLTPLSKLVDLALWTPEAGFVNFNALHTLLHAMLKKLKIQDVETDIDHDSDLELGVNTTLLKSSAVSLFEKGDNVVVDSENAKKSETATDLDDVKKEKKSQKKTRFTYNALSRKVEKLSQQMEHLNALPSNQELFERSKVDGERAVSDMWQYMQMKKRVDANEDGVGKLMSMMADLAKEMQALKESQAELENKIHNLDSRKSSRKDITSVEIITRLTASRDLGRRNSESDDFDNRTDDLEAILLEVATQKKKLDNLETCLNDLQEQTDWKQFVTWPLLEEALKGSQQKIIVEKIPEPPVTKKKQSRRTVKKSARKVAEGAVSESKFPAPDKVGSKIKKQESVIAETKTSEKVVSETKSQERVDTEPVSQDGIVLEMKEPEEVASETKQPEQVGSTTETPQKIGSEIKSVESSGSMIDSLERVGSKTESLQRENRVVVETNQQSVERPASSSKLDTENICGPSIHVLNYFEDLGKLNHAQSALIRRVEHLEGQLKNKAEQIDVERILSQTSLQFDDHEGAKPSDMTSSKYKVARKSSSGNNRGVRLQKSKPSLSSLHGSSSTSDTDVALKADTLLHPGGSSHVSMQTDLQPSERPVGTSRTSIQTEAEAAAIADKQESLPSLIPPSNSKYILLMSLRTSQTETFKSLLEEITFMENKVSLLYDKISGSVVPAQPIRESATPAQNIRESVAPAQNIRESVAPAHRVKESATPAQHVTESATPAQHVTERAAPAQHVTERAAPAQHIKERVELEQCIGEHEAPVTEVEAQPVTGVEAAPHVTEGEAPARVTEGEAPARVTEGEAPAKAVTECELKTDVKEADSGKLVEKAESLMEQDVNRMNEQKSKDRGNNLTNQMSEVINRIDDQIFCLNDKINYLDNVMKRVAYSLGVSLSVPVPNLIPFNLDSLDRVHVAMMQEQIEKLYCITQDLTAANQQKSKDIKDMLDYCDTFQDKLDKDYVAMEVNVKADKQQLERKVSHSLFNTTTSEMNRIIKEILDKLSETEDSYKSLANDIDCKLDRMELPPLKKWVETKLKVLNKKFKESTGDLMEDAAAGLRKQLLMRFNCLSCDRPVEIMPTAAISTLPQHPGMPVRKSSRPHTTYEMEHVRHSAKNTVGRNYQNLERAVEEKEMAKFRNADFKLHLYDAHTLRQYPKDTGFTVAEIADCYSMIRQCGGPHTTTFLRSFTTAGLTPYQMKEDIDVQGVDGHIYKGSTERVQLEAKLPTALTPSQYQLSTHPSSVMTHPSGQRNIQVSTPNHGSTQQDSPPSTSRGGSAQQRSSTSSHHGSAQQKGPTPSRDGSAQQHSSTPSLNGLGQQNSPTSTPRHGSGLQNSSSPSRHGSGQLNSPTSTPRHGSGLQNSSSPSRHGSGQLNSPTSTPRHGSGLQNSSTPSRHGSGQQNSPTPSLHRLGQQNSPTSSRHGSGQQNSPIPSRHGSAELNSPTLSHHSPGQQNSPTPSRHGSGQKNSLTSTRPGSGQQNSPIASRHGSAELKSPTLSRHSSGQLNRPTLSRHGSKQQNSPTPSLLGSGQQNSPTPSVHGSGQQNSPTPSAHGSGQQNSPTLSRHGSGQQNSPTLSHHGLEQQNSPSHHGSGEQISPTPSHHGSEQQNSPTQSLHGSVELKSPTVSHHGSEQKISPTPSHHGLEQQNSPSPSHHGSEHQNSPTASLHGSVELKSPTVSHHGSEQKISPTPSRPGSGDQNILSSTSRPESEQQNSPTSSLHGSVELKSPAVSHNGSEQQTSPTPSRPVCGDQNILSSTPRPGSGQQNSPSSSLHGSVELKSSTPSNHEEKKDHPTPWIREPSFLR